MEWRVTGWRLVRVVQRVEACVKVTVLETTMAGWSMVMILVSVGIGSVGVVGLRQPVAVTVDTMGRSTIRVTSCSLSEDSSRVSSEVTVVVTSVASVRVDTVGTDTVTTP